MSVVAADTKQTTNGAVVRAEPSNAVVAVAKQVKGYIEKGNLFLPADYSPENALKSAWLTLQEVKDKDNRPALQVCTQESIMNALLDMVVQGLNPSKKQCYFIVYGPKLICQRSYFGDQALAQRVRPNSEIYASVIYQGDTFETEMIRGRTTIAVHKSKLENQKLDKIIGAYCGIVDKETGEDLGCEVMTMAQIQKSWGMSKTYNPGGQKGTHHDFPDQMALRTVIRRRCKPLINSSSDALLLESVRRQDEDHIEAEVEEDSIIHGNGETLSLQSGGEATDAEIVESEDTEKIGRAPEAAGKSSADEELEFEG
jgi:recombination protein RecT